MDIWDEGQGQLCMNQMSLPISPVKCFVIKRSCYSFLMGLSPVFTIAVLLWDMIENLLPYVHKSSLYDGLSLQITSDVQCENLLMCLCHHLSLWRRWHFKRSVILGITQKHLHKNLDFKISLHRKGCHILPSALLAGLH